MNTIVNSTSSCPLNTYEWNYNIDNATKVCIHSTCYERVSSLFSYVQDNLFINNYFTGKTDKIDLTYNLSKMSCGAGNNEECISDECF